MCSTSLSAHERLASFLGGATAGFCVDLAVYPMDTIKTRLQSATHSVKPQCGGGLGLFAGLPAVIIGSAPGGKTRKAAICKVPNPLFSFVVFCHIRNRKTHNPLLGSSVMDGFYAICLSCGCCKSLNTHLLISNKDKS